MKNKNTRILLTDQELENIFGGTDDGCGLPVPKLPKKLVSDSEEENMPFSSGIKGDRRPHGSNVLDKYLKQQESPEKLDLPRN